MGFSHDFFGARGVMFSERSDLRFFFVEVERNDPPRANNFMINLDVRDTLDHVKNVGTW